MEIRTVQNFFSGWFTTSNHINKQVNHITYLQSCFLSLNLELPELQLAKTSEYELESTSAMLLQHMLEVNSNNFIKTKCGKYNYTMISSLEYGHILVKIEVPGGLLSYSKQHEIIKVSGEKYKQVLAKSIYLCDRKTYNMGVEFLLSRSGQELMLSGSVTERLLKYARDNLSRFKQFDNISNTTEKDKELSAQLVEKIKSASPTILSIEHLVPLALFYFKECHHEINFGLLVDVNSEGSLENILYTMSSDFFCRTITAVDEVHYRKCNAYKANELPMLEFIDSRLTYNTEHEWYYIDIILSKIMEYKEYYQGYYLAMNG